MKICVLGLDCAAPEIVFTDERLKNIRRLMKGGLWGRLESVIPPITVPAWMCMCTSQDPGSLGVYGFRNRRDHSYAGLGTTDSRAIRALAIWDYLALEGKKSIVVAVPPNYPPRKLNGISVGCFLTPNTQKNEFTYPVEIKNKITELVGDYPPDVEGFRTDDKVWLKKQIFEMSRKQWKVVHWLLREQEWDYFHFVDIGLDRMHHGFWSFSDKAHRQYQAGNPYESVIPEYYQWLDEQIGMAIESLPPDTIVLVVSDHGAQRLDGGFVVNEWLVKEGLLVLDEQPREVTPFAKLKVNWAKTRVWSEGGYYARVFFNVQGREPQGVIPASDYESFRDEIKSRFEALTDDEGRPLNSPVFRPEDIYHTVRNVSPDLIVHFGGLLWRSIGSVGHGRLHVQENDTGPDSCNHAQFGMFVLAALNWQETASSSGQPRVAVPRPETTSPDGQPRVAVPLGEYRGAHLLDVAPTLLKLAGSPIPKAMQGRPLL
jgi:predicted AlkP superfamily phosphohydrolase/phosphomutase